MSRCVRSNSKYKVKSNEDECGIQSMFHIHWVLCSKMVWNRLTKSNSMWIVGSKTYNCRQLPEDISRFRPYSVLIAYLVMWRFECKSHFHIAIAFDQWRRKYSILEWKSYFHFSSNLFECETVWKHRLFSHSCTNENIFKKRLHHKPCYLKRLQDERICFWKLEMNHVRFTGRKKVFFFLAVTIS